MIGRLLCWLGLWGPLMRLMHKFHLHYAPPMYPEGETVLWCDWCGLRYHVPKQVETLRCGRTR